MPEIVLSREFAMANARDAESPWRAVLQRIEAYARNLNPRPEEN